ncbi:cold shock domain-containing protein [Nocardioides zeae]|uniref:Cold shock domain-containing protein n=1 Tax=Nocardioides imazamoxiresistens TaxID=3231893 RepID=A0ABU3PQF8_9ACTN|nr:cold shock domain-containing protein [Nocardioides zeae]MDT9591459.1 cold shock domain-containing protein [Nocardioides zeae]
MAAGTVEWFEIDRGIGAITDDDGASCTVRAVQVDADLAELQAGRRVEFVVDRTDDESGPEALRVRVIGGDSARLVP